MFTEFFRNLTLLKCLSVSAFITTVMLFFCGIPICVNIWKRRSTKDISAVPFLMGVLGAVYWLRYGLIKMDYTMIAVNIFAATLMGIYLTFYYFMTEKKLWISIEVCAVIFLISLMLLLVQIFGHGVIHPLGFTCMTFNILNFGAPLAGLKVVLRQRNCETLPLPLCIANLLVSSQWALYGVLISDIYIIVNTECDWHDIGNDTNSTVSGIPDETRSPFTGTTLFRSFMLRYCSFLSLFR
ncbi:unnamed protein product [Onchocerca ochengi]|uniref:Sugar transporter SWEET n=1 Tax=Onchocerca ochengi TaxID=42157 RepID=A0A182EIS9_ONCOC|nr:unnamed protein product [Onchocerca ochengi]